MVRPNIRNGLIERGIGSVDVSLVVGSMSRWRSDSGDVSSVLAGLKLPAVNALRPSTLSEECKLELLFHADTMEEFGDLGQKLQVSSRGGSIRLP